MMRTVTFFVVALAFWANCVQAFQFPDEIMRCRIGDTECIKNVANVAIQMLPQGHSGINLVSIQPLNIPGIELKQGSNSPVNIHLSFKNVALYGLDNHVCTKVSGFQENPEGNYQLIFKGKALTLVGPYTISGRVLILPITGSGQSNITLVDPELTIKFTGKTKTKKGKVYMYTDDLKLTFTISKLYTHLENLYNGDRALGESTNLFLNENWKEIFGELKSSIFDAFTLIIQNTLNNVFNKVPYRELFSE